MTCDDVREALLMLPVAVALVVALWLVCAVLFAVAG